MKPLIPEKRRQEILAKCANTWETPLFQYWEGYVNDFCTVNRSKKTVENTRCTLNLFLLHSKLITIEDWSNQRSVQDELNRLRSERWWSDTTYGTYRKNMSAFFTYLMRFGYIDKNPGKNLIPAGNIILDQPVISNETIQKILRCVNSEGYTSNEFKLHRDRLFISLLILTWARPEELLRLKLESFSDRGIVKIKTAKGSGKSRPYPLNTRTQDFLTLYIREVVKRGYADRLSNHFFLSVKKGAPWSYLGIRKLCERISEKIGDKFTAYGFRRRAATEMIKKHVAVEVIQLHMWHIRQSTTMRYIQGDSTLNKEGVELLASGLDWGE